ncbi:MAG: RyR domain-containing protein [Pseudomonadota bacterium]
MSEPDITAISRVVHDAIRAWSVANGQPLLPEWDEAPDWMRDSTAESVEFTIANPSAPPSAQHDQWMRQKERDGWRHGAEKDPEAKTHPMMVPYEELPTMERRKDALLKAVVIALSEPI